MRRLVLVLAGGFVSACGGGDGGGPPTITAVVINGDSTVIIAGNRQLAATAMSGSIAVTSGVTFTWSSSDTTIATVAPSGLVSGVRLGTAGITALAVLNGMPTSVSNTRNIRTRIGSIVITPNSPQIASLGDSILASAEARNALNGAVPGIAFAWQTRNAGVAEVTPRAGNQQADVTALTNGTTRIVVTGDGVSDSISVTVRQIATSLSLTPESDTFHSVSATLTPTITAADARGNPVAPAALGWTSTVPGVTTIDPATGMITALDEGETKVIATSGALADTVAITVDQIPASITVTPENFGTSDVTMRINQTAPFYATVRDSLGQIAKHDTVTWGSTNTGLANVAPARSISSTIVTTFAGGGITNIGVAVDVPGQNPLQVFRVLNITSAPLSFALDVQPVFNTSCTGCHTGGGAPEGLSLVSNVAYANLVEHASGQSSLRRARAFRPDSSYLVHKLQGTQGSVGGSGVRMPFGCSGGGCLPNATINMIRNWILQGAQNN